MVTDDERFQLEQEKLKLDRERLALERSFPRKWGAFIFGTMLMGAVAIAGAFVNVYKSLADKAYQQEQLNRDALAIYFDHPDMFDGDRLREIAKLRLRLLQTITTGELRDGFLDVTVSIAAKSMGTTDDAQRAEVISTLPDLIATPADGKYKFSDFVGYIQYPDGAIEKARELSSAIAALGIKVPGLEQVRAPPNNNEIRYYLPEQKGIATALADRLKSDLKLDFVAKPLHSEKRLPDGIIELWLGEGG